MEPHQLDENDEQCEIARTAAADKLMNDTTAFFDDIRIEDDANHVLKAITGNGIRFDDDAAPVMSPQTTENRALFASLEPSERSGFDEDKHKEEGEKVRQFLSNLKNYPEWARSIPYVKLNAAVPKKIQMELALHLYANVNVRPKYMLMMTKDMDKNDLAMLVQKAFEPEDDIPQERTLFRLYCKNAVSGMRSMLKCLLDIATSSPALQIKNSKIVGEMKYNGSNVRMETSDLKAFYQVEEHGRALGVRFVTNFSITSTSDHRRTPGHTLLRRTEIKW
ncbi:hypothetical protein KIN20_019813 [Parelaphostrongylus tenuis]|uniref:Uncharacterized protein n=1 Tax=Parelaphostrongylus tenuis TaxID=148309 RepID=A0AAD5QT51_PARTN|nr:hypothetical protein KIN20_019813 [Parelaphostrongylus tenuis]